MTEHEFRDYLQTRGQVHDAGALFATLGFTHGFIAANVLSAGGTVTVSRVAMLWQGMPNKHDRKRTRQLFDELGRLGLLEPCGDDETWTVRSPPT